MSRDDLYPLFRPAMRQDAVAEHRRHILNCRRGDPVAKCARDHHASCRSPCAHHRLGPSPPVLPLPEHRRALLWLDRPRCTRRRCSFLFAPRCRPASSQSRGRRDEKTSIASTTKPRLRHIAHGVRNALGIVRGPPPVRSSIWNIPPVPPRARRPFSGTAHRFPRRNRKVRPRRKIN